MDGVGTVAPFERNEALYGPISRGLHQQYYPTQIAAIQLRLWRRETLPPSDEDHKRAHRLCKRVRTPVDQGDISHLRRGAPAITGEANASCCQSVSYSALPKDR